MVAAAGVRVADGIALIDGHFRMRFVGQNRRYVTGGVFAGDPVGTDTEFRTQRLFDPELASRPLGPRRKDIGAGVVTAESQARI